MKAQVLNFNVDNWPRVTLHLVIKGGSMAHAMDKLDLLSAIVRSCERVESPPISPDPESEPHL